MRPTPSNFISQVFPALLLLLCLWTELSLAGAVDKSDLAKRNNKEKLEDERFGQYLKDSKSKLSTVQKRNDFAHIVKILVQRFNQYTNATQNSTGSMRAFPSQIGLSPKTIGKCAFNLFYEFDYGIMMKILTNQGNLALASLLLYGAMASFAPERMNEISRHIALEDRQGVQNIITSGLVGVSESLMGWVSSKFVFIFRKGNKLKPKSGLFRRVVFAHLSAMTDFERPQNRADLKFEFTLA